MALRSIQVTLGASATQVTATRKGVRQMWFMPAAHDYYVGVGTAALGGPVDSTHGVKIPVPTSNVPYAIVSLGPFSGDEPLNTTDVYLLGTQNDVVQILVVTG